VLALRSQVCTNETIKIGVDHVIVAGHDWRDGLGPKDQRPRRMELAWNVVESTPVGTCWADKRAEYGRPLHCGINAPRTEQVATNGATIHYSFSAHSITQIVVGISRQ